MRTCHSIDLELLREALGVVELAVERDAGGDALGEGELFEAEMGETDEGAVGGAT